MNGGAQAGQPPSAEAFRAVAGSGRAEAAPPPTSARTDTLSLRGYLVRLVTLSMVPLLALVGWLGASDVVSQGERQHRTAERAAARLMHEVEDHVEQRIRALEVLARLPLSHDAEGQERLYREALAYRDTFGSHVVLADADRHMLFNTRLPWGSELPKLPQPKGQAAVSVALLTGRPAVGDLLIGPVVGEPLVAIAVPVLRDGHAPLLLLSTLTPLELQGALAHGQLPPEMRARLLDGTGQVITELGSTAEPAEAHFTTASALAPWSVMLEVDRSAYTAPVQMAGVRLLLEALAAGLTAAVVGQLASRRLSAAVQALSDPPAATGAAAAPRSGIREVDAARDQLDQANDDRLEALAVRAAALRKLEASHTQLEQVVEALHTAQEDERRRIARDVHDELQQRLAAIRIEVSALGPQVPGASGVSRVDGLVVDAIDATRRIVQDLRPQALDELGLPAALAEMLSHFSRLSGIASELDLMVPDGVDDPSTLLSPAAGTCLYRIAQEALNNVRKHSGAGFVHLCLDLRSAGRAELLVSDDGRGVQAGELDAHGSFGVRGMSERVRALDGELEVRPLAAGGTLVRASIPL